jgi:hypothetical protein
LNAAVQHHNCWYAKAANPVVEEGRGAGGGVGGGEQNCFGPVVRVVDDGEKVIKTKGDREQAHNVDIDVSKTMGRHGNCRRLRLGVCGCLGTLAREAFGCPLRDLHAWPHKVGRDQTLHGAAARVAIIVQGIEKGVMKGSGISEQKTGVNTSPYR